MDLWEAQYRFWSSFGVPAYRENSVPEQKDLTYPFITFQAASGNFGAVATVSGNIYTRSTALTEADRLADAVLDRLGGRDGGGYPLRYDGGGLWFVASEQFAQDFDEPEDDSIKRKLLTVEIHFA